MKKNIVIAATALALCLAGCNRSKTTEQNPEELKSYTVKGNLPPEETPADTTKAATAQQAPADMAMPAEGEEVTLRGKVTEVTPGKDGYMAKLKIAEGQFFTATVSIPNMKDPAQYKKVNVGEMITVTGSYYKIGKDNAVKVAAFE
jgi:hypothetical protein